MRKLLQKIEALLAAAAFAEEGEVETARRLLSEAARGEARPAPARSAGEGGRAAGRPKIARLP